MKKQWLILVLLCLYTTMIFAEGNYQGGNGTVISRLTDGNQTIEIRKLEISNVQAGDMLAENNNTIYTSYTTQNPVGELEWQRERFNIHKVCSIELQETDQWGHPLGEMWLEISTKKLKGWICYNDRYPSTLYTDNKYAIIETIAIASQTWTVRKLEQLFTIWRTVDIMDTPGFSSMDVPGFEKEDLWICYREFVSYEPYCKFQGCSHITEPSCGVKDALAEGKISQTRYDNYVLLYNELKQIRKY